MVVLGGGAIFMSVEVVTILVSYMRILLHPADHFHSSFLSYGGIYSLMLSVKLSHRLNSSTFGGISYY